MFPPYNFTDNNGWDAKFYVQYSATVQCGANGCPTSAFNYYNYTNTVTQTGSYANRLPYLFPTSTNMVNKLHYPSNLQGQPTNSRSLEPGVYTFNFWAETLCGKQMSTPVNLIARCPPTPTSCIVVRNAATNMAISANNGMYSVYQGDSILFDGTGSYAYQFSIPRAFNNTFQLISAAYTVTPSGPSWLQTLGSNLSPCTGSNCNCVYTQNDQDRCERAYFSFLKAGQYTVQLSVSDGCSTGSTSVSVMVQCSCTPSAMATAVYTLNTNSAQGQNLNNHVAPGTVSWNL
jgi:hypothetical protein